MRLLANYLVLGTLLLAAGYAAEHPDGVSRLVLVAPVWPGLQPPKYTGAYRTSTHESARAASA